MAKLKSPRHVELGKTTFERYGIEGMSDRGKIGGKAAAAKMTPEQLSERGRRARAGRTANEAIRKQAYAEAMQVLTARQQLQQKNCEACLAAMEKALANPGRLIKQALASAKK